MLDRGGVWNREKGKRKGRKGTFLIFGGGGGRGRGGGDKYLVKGRGERRKEFGPVRGGNDGLSLSVF